MSQTTTITLAGTQWLVPLHEKYREKLARKSLVKIVALAHANDEAVPPINIADATPEDVNLAKRRFEAAVVNLGDEEFVFLEDVVFTVLHEAYPEISKDDFLDMPIGVGEMVGAVLVIASDLGLIKKKVLN